MTLFSRYRELRRRHKRAFTLIELMVAVAIIGAIASLAVVNYEKFVCKAQETEAKTTLHNIFAIESDVFANYSQYDALGPCTFGYGPPVCTAVHIAIEFVGRSRFTYSVDTGTDTFLAHAVGTTGHVLGAHLTIDQDGKLDTSGTVCK